MKRLLDEEQGLTEEMVTGYARSHGWTSRATATGIRWSPSGGNGNFGGDDPLMLLARIADYEGRSMQEMLRIINPRMRPLPSPEARKAHNGRWIAMNPEGRGYIISFDEMYLDTSFSQQIVSFTTHIHRQRGEGGEFVEEQVFRITEDQLARWLFWPCDEMANKVSWPEKHGVMI